MPSAPVPPAAVLPREAGAAIVLRDGPGGIEVLLAQRSSGSRFLPGFWVFPGGRVEPRDGAGDERWSAAAVREVAEEVGLHLDPATLAPFDRWITPEGLPVRFDTVFFLAPAGAAQVPVIDAHEIVGTRWTRPSRVLADAEAGLPVLTYPTLAQLQRLAAFPTVAAALAACGGLPDRPTITGIRMVDGRPAMVVAGADGVPRRFRDGPVGDNELAPGFPPRRPGDDAETVGSPDPAGDDEPADGSRP